MPIPGLQNLCTLKETDDDGERGRISFTKENYAVEEAGKEREDSKE